MKGTSETEDNSHERGSDAGGSPLRRARVGLDRMIADYLGKQGYFEALSVFEVSEIHKNIVRDEARSLDLTQSE